MYVGGGDASERDYLSESRRLVSTHCNQRITFQPPLNVSSSQP